MQAVFGANKHWNASLRAWNRTHTSRRRKEFYTDQASMRENQLPPRVGRDLHLAAERKVLSRVRNMHSQCVRPAFVNGEHVVIRWMFVFEWLDGSVTKMEEIAYQRWEAERIAEEQFFYDPGQLKAP